jgi:hypothetical protein
MTKDEVIQQMRAEESKPNAARLQESQVFSRLENYFEHKDQGQDPRRKDYQASAARIPDLREIIAPPLQKVNRTIDETDKKFKELNKTLKQNADLQEKDSKERKKPKSRSNEERESYVPSRGFSKGSRGGAGLSGAREFGINALASMIPGGSILAEALGLSGKVERGWQNFKNRREESKANKINAKTTLAPGSTKITNDADLTQNKGILDKIMDLFKSAGAGAAGGAAAGGAGAGIATTLAGAGAATIAGVGAAAVASGVLKEKLLKQTTYDVNKGKHVEFNVNGMPLKDVEKQISDGIAGGIVKSKEELKIIGQDVQDVVGKVKSVSKKYGEDVVNISKEMANAINEKADKYGLSAKGLAAEIMVESSFNSKAGAGTSSAKGAGQFIDSTWARYGKGKNVYDIDANIDAKARFNIDNKKILEANGFEATPGNMYMAHFLGPAKSETIKKGKRKGQMSEGGASEFLLKMQDNPNSVAADLFPTAANSNKNIFFGKDSSGKRTVKRSLQKVYDLQVGKVKNADLWLQQNALEFSPQKSSGDLSQPLAESSTANGSMLMRSPMQFQPSGPTSEGTNLQSPTYGQRETGIDDIHLAGFKAFNGM